MNICGTIVHKRGITTPSPSCNFLTCLRVVSSSSYLRKDTTERLQLALAPTVGGFSGGLMNLVIIISISGIPRNGLAASVQTQMER